MTYCLVPLSLSGKGVRQIHLDKSGTGVVMSFSLRRPDCRRRLKVADSLIQVAAVCAKITQIVVGHVVAGCYCQSVAPKRLAIAPVRHLVKCAGGQRSDHHNCRASGDLSRPLTAL